MSDHNFFLKEFEDYLLTGNEEPIKSLPNTSKEKEYFFIIRELLNSEFTPELENKITKFISKNDIPEEQTIRLKALLIYKRIQKTPEKKEKIIKDIKELFHIENAKTYTKPIKYNKIDEDNDEKKDEKNMPSKLDFDKYINIYQFIEDVYSGKVLPSDKNIEDILGSEDLNYKFDFYKIPFDTILKIFFDEEPYCKIQFDFNRSENLDFFKKLIKAFDEKCKEKEENIEEVKYFADNYNKYLTNEQIEIMLKYDKFNFLSLINELFAREFSKLSQICKTNKEEMVKQLKEITKFCKKYKQLDAVTQLITRIILVYNLTLNIFELDTFIDYIKLPIDNDLQFYNETDELREKTEEMMNLDGGEILGETIAKIIPREEIFSFKEKELIEIYLKHFYLYKKIDFSKLSEYFKENYIKKFYAKMKFYSGSEIPTKDDILSSSDIEQLMKQVILMLCKSNKESFNINDDIELNLEIKNVQNLYINIYEINTENYYYTNNAEFNDNISLDGIIPTYQDIITYNEKPQILSEKKIKIDKIPKKRGLYVIEFIGNGHVCRAIIQKGNLKCIHKNTVNGKVLYILDENNKILKGEKTGLWINNIWYPSIKDSGAILIPYSTKEGCVILKHDNFCCLEEDISIPNEEYELDGQFIINEESFIMGNVTKILVKSYLYICDEICPLEHLKNVKIIINSIKTENNEEIPSMNIIDNVILSYNKEFSFDFQVPPKLKSVEFILSADIDFKSKIYTKNLSFSEKYNFTRNYEYDSLIKKDDNDNYIIHFLGKNGEPKINNTIVLDIEHILQKSVNNDKEIFLETDNNGMINLGKLKDVKEIELNNDLIPIKPKEKYSYCKTITILEEEIINIPFKSLENNEIRLINALNNQIMTHLLKIEITDEKNKLGNITLPKLNKGEYKLLINYLQMKLMIKIKVIKGKKMNIKNYIITDDENILYHNNDDTPIAIENVSYKDKTLKIKLNKDKKNQSHPRIHINCVQYLPKILNKNVENFVKSRYFEKIHQQIKYKSNHYENSYLNNKILSDELQYVLDRKQYENNLGNSLENPSLLLKPQFIRETTTEIKKGDEGEDFERSMARKKNYDYSEDYSDDEEKDEDNSYRSEYDRKDIIKVHDFINKSPYTKDNLIPDEKGEIILKDIDLDEYSFIHILCFDNISCNEDWFYLKNGKTSLRDLRAVNEFDINKNYCEFRKLYPLSKKEKHHINDITSIKYKIFDSLEKYLEFIKIVNPYLEKDIKEFEFLLNFDNLNLPEKLEKITQYFSHELNIYLYFHHNDFFNKYIYPILKYKSEKTFIDFFLLNDIEKIKEYSNPQNIEQLNIFEKCLLIYSIRNENKILANSIARQIRAKCPKDNKRELIRLFNIAINLKSIEEKLDEEKIEEECLKEGIIEIESESIKKKCKKRKKCKKAEKPKYMAKKCCLMDYDYDEFDVDDNIAKEINLKAQIFKEEGKSKEFCETQYYNKVYKNNDYKDIISYNNFFADLAKYWSENDSKRNIGFKSENILLIPNNITELIFILSILDLEEKTKKQSHNFIKDKGLGLTIEVNTNVYILTKEINETLLNTDNKYSLILAQMIFEKDKKDKNEEKEPTKFLINRTYIQKTIVTNISSEDINCEILMQIPEGSIPVDSDEYKIIETANINSYTSVIYEQSFYFPEKGMFKQYPASASINDLVIAKAGLKTFEVVSNIQLTKDEISTIDDVLNQGNKEEIIEFINKKEIIDEKDLEKIYWMLKDKDFYDKLINILKNKYIYDNNIWEYSTENMDLNSLQEYILNNKQKNILKSIGHEFDLIFLKLDKTNNAHILNHLDYYPILKNRIFKLPKSKSILTKQLRDTYEQYISYLISLEKINDYEYMRLCYYLILQQRIKEATIIYNKINKNNIIGNNFNSLNLQYDYLTAYLDFNNGYPKFEKAREICQKYKDISISNWKNMFNEIEDELNEYDGKMNIDKELIENEQDEKNKTDKHKAQFEEILNIDIKDQNINIIYKNISEITVKYFLIDIEILFSRSPFVKKTKVDFGFIKPQRIDKIKVEKQCNENKYLLNIPDDLKNKNFYIEISSGKIKESEIYNSSLLKYSVYESIGEIKVMSPELKPLPKVYVKCFCETTNGQIKFYKDGFTDLRGKFDYISLNNDLINQVNKFSILMASKEYGSIIVTCKPPKIIRDSVGIDNIQKIFDYRQQTKNKFRK